MTLCEHACFLTLSEVWSTVTLCEHACFLTLSEVWSTVTLCEHACFLALSEVWSTVTFSVSFVLFSLTYTATIIHAVCKVLYSQQVFSVMYLLSNILVSVYRPCWLAHCTDLWPMKLTRMTLTLNYLKSLGPTHCEFSTNLSGCLWLCVCFLVDASFMAR